MVAYVREMSKHTAKGDLKRRYEMAKQKSNIDTVRASQRKLDYVYTEARGASLAHMQLDHFKRSEDRQVAAALEISRRDVAADEKELADASLMSIKEEEERDKRDARREEALRDDTLEATVASLEAKRANDDLERAQILQAELLSLEDSKLQKAGDEQEQETALKAVAGLEVPPAEEVPAPAEEAPEEAPPPAEEDVPAPAEEAPAEEEEEEEAPRPKQRLRRDVKTGENLKAEMETALDEQRRESRAEKMRLIREGGPRDEEEGEGATG